MIKYVKIIAFTALLLHMGGCRNAVMFNQSKEKIVAKVGTSELTEADINNMPKTSGSPEDSVKLVEAYVNNWIRKQVKLQEAERVFADSGLDIEAMVNDYRNSLLSQRLDSYYVERNVDTLISDSLISTYFNTHKSEFILDRSIVKGRIVRVPNSFRQKDRLKALMGSSKENEQRDFIDMAAKNNLELTTFESWTDFNTFLMYLPTMRDRNYDNMLVVNRIQEMADAENKYYVQITDFLKKGDEAPLERVEHIIKRIIYNQRSSDVVKRSEDSLVNAAMQQNKVVINLN